MTQILGYARVSTTRQSLDQQHDALDEAGVQRIFDDKLSGKRDDRPGLSALLDYARTGDVIVVAALDRLGRDLSHIIATVADLDRRGIVLRSLREGIDSSTPHGKMLMGIFGSLSQYEHSLIKERTEAKRDAARERGQHIGRPFALNDAQKRQARALRESGESVADICATLSISRPTFYRYMKAHS